MMQNHKLLPLSVLVIFLSLITSSVFITNRKLNLPPRIITTTPTPTTAPGFNKVLTVEDVLYMRSMDTPSFDGKYVAYFWVHPYDKDNKKRGINIDLVISSYNDHLNKISGFPIDTIYRTSTTISSSIPNTPFLKSLYDYQHYFSDFLNEDSRHSRLAWSPSGLNLAVYWPDNIEIFYFSRPSFQTLNYQKTQHVKTFLKIDKLFFSGDSSRVYLVSGTGLSYIDLADLQLHLTNIQVQYSSFLYSYPVPGSKGVTYWHEDKTNQYVVIDEDGSKKNYPIPSEQMDGLGKILLSPDLKHACVEYGSSGYWGFLVFRLSDSAKIADGQQYSYCRRWISNDQLLVVEKPYFHQGFYNWYQIDVSSQNKTYLDSATVPDSP